MPGELGRIESHLRRVFFHDQGDAFCQERGGADMIAATDAAKKVAFCERSARHGSSATTGQYVASVSRRVLRMFAPKKT